MQFAWCYLPISTLFFTKRRFVILKENRQTPDEVLKQQTVLNPAAKTYTARCSVCGKAFSRKKRLFHSQAAEMEKLRMNFNFCRTCCKWVCEDCFYIDDGNGNSIGLCSACAGKKGLSGLTAVQFEDAWPQIQKLRQTRYMVMKRAMEKSHE